MEQPWIFVDFDGTAIDNLEKLKRAFFAFGSDIGLSLTDKDFERANGPSDREIMSDMRKRFSLTKYSVAQLVRLHESHAEVAYKNSTPRRDLYKVLSSLKKAGWKCALVTASPRKVVQPFFKKAGWDKIFEFIVTCDDVKRAKPNPDLYNLAIKRAGGEGPFLAIEDSNAGVLSAKRAGCIPLYFDPQSPTRFLGISSFTELHRRLQLIDGSPFLTAESGIRLKAMGLLSDSPYWPADNRKDMERIWKNSKKNNKNLFDGLIYVIEKETKPFELDGKFVRYRHIYPQLTLHGSAFPIRVAVNAMLRREKTIYISKRSDTVTEFPGKWEFAPSGAVGSNTADTTTLNLKEQILDELHHEFGITRKSSNNILPELTVLDLASRIIEVFYSIPLQDDDIITIDKEHTQYSGISRASLKRKLLKNPEEFTPITKIIAKNV